MKKHRKYSFHTRKQQGWGMNLYRNKEEGYIAGVCAGLAEHFDVDNWIVRLIFIAGLIFLNSLAIFAYVAAWILLAERNENSEETYEYDEVRHRYAPKKMFKYSDETSVRLKRASDRLKKAVNRVENMERYVTSRKFKLDQEFADIKNQE